MSDNENTSKKIQGKDVEAKRDEVHEAGDESFPASDPPAYTSAAPQTQTKWAKGKSAPKGTDLPIS